MKSTKTILVAPLNWGLGHATRCMPIINHLLKRGINVILASDGNALNLLTKEYPQLPHVSLPSYDITYKTSNMFINIAPQVPKILNAIRLERKLLDTIISQYKIDAIISDNRYGLRHPSIPCVFITHQLNIIVPNQLLSSWTRWMNQRYIKQFTACWVPDYAEEPNLAGQLSHGHWDNITYIGMLSRMHYQEQQAQHDILVVLSGPEPQRSILEQKIIQQAQNIDQQFIIVAGQTQDYTVEQLTPNIKRYSYMTSQALNATILNSKVIIARSGYSTVMDLVQLQCKQVILIPTPGQTEQEFLAERFYQQKQFYYQHQKDLNLTLALKELQNFSGLFPYTTQNNSTLENTIDNFLNQLTSHS